ncbi:sulfite exporter TauE/SafE family protein [Tistrella bauzanensis]
MSTMPTFMGGLLLGLAGSLHCAGICGGIASATLIAADPGGTARARAGALMQIQLGRAATYTLAGGAVGAGSGRWPGCWIWRAPINCCGCWPPPTCCGWGRRWPASARGRGCSMAGRGRSAG